MEKIKVIVFGSYAPPCGDCEPDPHNNECSSCGTVDIMKAEAGHLKKLLKNKYGDAVDCAYVDVESEEMESYPDIKKILKNNRLPLTAVNGEPRFQNGVSMKKTSEAIDQILKGPVN